MIARGGSNIPRPYVVATSFLREKHENLLQSHWDLLNVMESHAHLWTHLYSLSRVLVLLLALVSLGQCALVSLGQLLELEGDRDSGWSYKQKTGKRMVCDLIQSEHLAFVCGSQPSLLSSVCYVLVLLC